MTVDVAKKKYIYW